MSHRLPRDSPLGTIGALSLIRDELPEVFIVTNGDVVTDLNLRSMVDFHCRQGAVATIACHRRQVSIEYGVVGLNGGSRVRSFQEKPTEHVIVNMGIYVFRRDILRYIPEGTPFGVDDLIHSLLAAGEAVHSYLHEGQWLDIGSVRELGMAQDLLHACRDRILGD